MVLFIGRAMHILPSESVQCSPRYFYQSPSAYQIDPRPQKICRGRGYVDPQSIRGVEATWTGRINTAQNTEFPTTILDKLGSVISMV